MRRTRAIFVFLVCVLGAGMANAVESLQTEQISIVSLGDPSPHWLLVNDPNFLGYMDSKVFLMDADDGSMLGMLSTGGYHGSVEMDATFDTIYSPETYYERVTRGKRTEVITIYETENLTATGEIIIPPRRATGAMHRGYNGLSDDGRFMYVANMTPAMSVTVVDVETSEFTSEIATAGCMIIFPTGDRTFAMLCGDGSALHVRIGDAGQLVSKTRSEVFFDAAADPIAENSARIGDTWYLVSFSGVVYPLTNRGGELSAGRSWRLTGDMQAQSGWRPGGPQFIAGHALSGRLFITMNQDGPHSHKSAGPEIWVFNAATGKRQARFEAPKHVGRVAVSHDDDPLLVAAGESPEVFVIDPDDGEVLRIIEGPILGAGILQFPKL